MVHEMAGKHRIAIAVILCILLIHTAAADVTLPSLICDNMVIQRGQVVPIWGRADPGTTVHVDFMDDRLEAATDAKGSWQVSLPPSEAGGPYTMRISQNNEILIENVMIGDVWFCSGQSNMEMYVMHAANGPEEVADAFHDNIRLFQVTNEVSPHPKTDFAGTWEVCRPSTVGTFSATAYYFGREINRELGVPIGLIHASWGGTPAEVWIRKDALELKAPYRFILKRWEAVMNHPSSEVVEYLNRMGQWHEDIYHVVHLGHPLPTPPAEPDSPVKIGWVPRIPGWCWNAMVAPAVRYGVTGIIWYQGESNASRAYQYRSLFADLITDWRDAWGRDDLPFCFVQLANYGPVAESLGESAWAELREAQSMALALPATAMAVAIDIGDSTDVHPLNKQEVGRRLALGALAAAYGRRIECSGPLLEAMTVEDGRCRITFTHAGSGLTAGSGERLTGFAVAGEDRVWVTADARIEGDTVIVWSEGVPKPAAVRYGWADNPRCNLYNGAGLPASPFRTDEWPGVTADLL